MNRKMLFLIVLVAVGLYLLASPVLFTVDQYEDIAIVKTFGSVTGEALRGEKGAGLHFKAPWPFQSVSRYHARAFITEAPNEQVTTRDRKTVLLNTFCNWRIDDAIKFDNAVGRDGSADKAEQFIRDRLQSARGAVVTQRNMEEIINTDPSRMKLQDMEKDILQAVAKVAKDELGIEVTAVGIHVLALPPDVTTAVLQSQVAERNTEIGNYEKQGDAQAAAIVNRANTAANEILAFAMRRAEFIRTEGQRDAEQYYATFRENERLAMFLRMLDSLRKELPSKSMMIIGQDTNPALEFFYNRPSLESIKLPEEVKKSQEKTPAGK